MLNCVCTLPSRLSEIPLIRLTEEVDADARAPVPTPHAYSVHAETKRRLIVALERVAVLEGRANTSDRLARETTDRFEKAKATWKQKELEARAVLEQTKLEVVAILERTQLEGQAALEQKGLEAQAALERTELELKTALQENVRMRECWAAEIAWRNRMQLSMQHMPAPTDAFLQ
jgi:hypothetical protein